MKDLWYLQHEEWFSNLAFQAFEKYFNSRSQFDAFVNSIVGDEEKSRFLNVASHYKFLIKDGGFSVDGYEEAKYFDETYRFLLFARSSSGLNRVCASRGSTVG
jgi:hypothetical protein